MRLHSLTMTAIGPYVDTERIDFDALAADGLFLFTGPTGAGKSTVLDAVTYALYGKLPGNRDGHVSRLKSDFAAPEAVPEVILEVTVAGDRLRIHRSPAFERPKKRDPHSVTLQRSAVSVERLTDGAWLGIEGARKEQVANEWLHEKIGLNADQFAQVVLLPQGQFAEFLHANDDVREKLLTSLFDAHRFKDVESWFDDRQRAEMALAAEADAKVATLRTRVQTIADIADDEVPEVIDVDWFTGLRDRQSELAKETTLRREVTARLHEEAQERLRAAEGIVELFAERTAARGLAERVEQQRERIAAQRDRAARASAAASVLPLIQARDARAQAFETTSAALSAARANLERSEPQLLDQSAAKVRQRARTMTAQRGALAELIATEQAIDARRTELQIAQDSADEAAKAIDVLLAQQKELPSARSKAVALASELRERAAVLEDANDAVEQLKGAIKAAREAAKLRARLIEAEDFARTKRDDVLAAREYLNDLRERRIAGMAAEIAESLQDGEPCKVCGSRSHPEPARRADDAPTAEQIELAGQRLEECRNLEQSAKASVSDLTARRAAAEAIAAGRSVLELKESLKAAEQRRTAANEAVQQLPEVESDIARIDSEIDEADERLAAARSRREALTAAHRDLAAEVSRDSARLEQARAGYESVAERVGEIDAAVRIIDSYLDAHTAHDSAADELAAATQSAIDATKRAEFDSIDDAVAAALSKRELSEVQQQITQFERDDVAAHTRLADPKLLDLPAEEPDLEPLRAAAMQARAEADQARDTATTQQDVQRRLAEVADQARTEVAEACAIAARANQIKELALLVRGMGSNEKRMNLTAYFLAARLEQVTAVASEHLRIMSSGRYTLRHTDERRTARGHGGLGLEVFDAYTGKPRPPHSLSGGETFVASLSLALGLAEVVTAETGAMTLDSLFIDEGFGSLDPDTLDQAMSVLDGLRQVGRTIGVISHVEEMRTRITNQLVIERTDRGSRVLPH